MKFNRGNLFLYLILTAAIVSLILNIIVSPPIIRLDKTISTYVPALWFSSPLNTAVIIYSNYIFVYGLLISSVIILLYFLNKKNNIKAGFFAAVMLIGLIATETIKVIVQRLRPNISLVADNSFSFPSLHTVMATIFFLAIISLFKNQIKNSTKKFILILVSIFIILLTGFTRIFLNVHYFSDVLAGLIIGAGVFIYFFIIYKIFPLDTRRKNQRN